MKKEKIDGRPYDRNDYGPPLIPWENGCFVCGRNGPLQRHEIFHGPYRLKSKQYGCWTTLCKGCHDKVHRDALLDRKLKVIFQHRAMKTYGWDMDQWRQVFGKNYEEEDYDLPAGLPGEDGDLPRGL